MGEKYYSKLSTNLLLMRENKGKKEVLLQLRQNTGYMDGMYDFTCGGHVEKNESYAKAMIRKSSEEIGITIKEEDLIFLIVFHHFQDDYVQVVFTANNYEEVPTIKESDLCKELLWVDINSIPENTIPYVKNIVKDIELGIPYDDGNFTNL